VKNAIKLGPLVFLLQMFVITKNIMKRPTYIATYFVSLNDFYLSLSKYLPIVLYLILIIAS